MTRRDLATFWQQRKLWPFVWGWLRLGVDEGGGSGHTQDWVKRQRGPWGLRRTKQYKKPPNMSEPSVPFWRKLGWECSLEVFGVPTLMQGCVHRGNTFTDQTGGLILLGRCFKERNDFSTSRHSLWTSTQQQIKKKEVIIKYHIKEQWQHTSWELTWPFDFQTDVTIHPETCFAAN